MDKDGWGASRREPEPASGWMASQWMPSGILELLWPPNCQTWDISFLSEWECYQQYFVVWVCVRGCVGGVCRYLICIQTWCRDWDESPRDPGLWAWHHNLGGAFRSFPLGKGWVYFACRKKSESHFWWLEGQSVVVTFPLTISGFLHSGHTKGASWLSGVLWQVLATEFLGRGIYVLVQGRLGPLSEWSRW